MSHSSVPRRRPHREYEEADDSDATNSPPASNNKRHRPSPAQNVMTGDGDDESASSDTTEDSTSDTSEKSTQNISQRPRVHPDIGPGGYKAGAIVRIKVTNFVTYTQAEFFPGPKLNMVIGPNGTGKSTLVCAICLGLGWGPQV